MRLKARSGNRRKEEFPANAGPVRSCIGCGARRVQEELTRLAVGPEGAVVVDRARRLPGRGAYLCGAGCLAAAVKRKAFGRAFRGKAGAVDPSALGQALESGPAQGGAAGGSGC
ncbi:YlxR family RNase P modulator [Archangium sp.]|uniref:YlxR family protein n=1 Tax=Archangium sp. TaxID=1872627 RepID=UPI002D4EE6C7|nr:YlxR family RNase P modulator [Archangium sp.]HYO57931.1 YlxR family RNase P modulator [Archangium sp.]